MRADWQRPHPSRLDPTRPDRELILRTHAAAIAAGEPGYTDPSTGAFVFTAAALAGTGRCCEQGCRHCPWISSP